MHKELVPPGTKALGLAVSLAQGFVNSNFFTRLRDCVAMARALKARGRGRRPQVVEQADEPSSSSWRRGKKPVVNLVNEATTTYREGTSKEIKRLIEEWEANLNRQANATKIEMEDFHMLVSDPGHTRGRVT